VNIGFTSTDDDRQMRFAEREAMFDQSTDGFVMTARFAGCQKNVNTAPPFDWRRGLVAY
jgi:hypothetical protein